jgi:hypothetical protein
MKQLRAFGQTPRGLDSIKGGGILRAMNHVVKTSLNFIERLGRWAYPQTQAGRLTGDIATVTLAILSALVFLLSLR